MARPGRRRARAERKSGAWLGAAVVAVLTIHAGACDPPPEDGDVQGSAATAEDEAHLPSVGDDADLCAALGVIAPAGEDCVDYEAVIAGLAEAPMAYTKPEAMVRDRATQVSLVIDMTAQADPAAALGEVPDEIGAARTKVSRHMSAELSGAAFAIEPAGLKRKLMTATSPVHWDWTVTPRQAGDDRMLVLTVYAHIEAAGEVSAPITVRTFRDRIAVDVAPWDRVVDAARAIQPVYAVGAAAVAGAWGLFVWCRRRGWRTGRDDR